MGLSAATIAEKYDISAKTVLRYEIKVCVDRDFGVWAEEEKRKDSSLLIQSLQKMIRDIFETTGGFLTCDDYLDIIQQQGVDVGRSSIYRAMKAVKGKVGLCRVVPLLTDNHKAARLEWSRKQLAKPLCDRWGNDDEVVVWLDEKWFYIAPLKRQWVSMDGKTTQVALKTKSKTQMTKVMFLCAVARPNAAKGFSGRICCLPIVEERAAKRGSKYLKKGEMRVDSLTLDFEKFFAFMTEEGGLVDQTLEAVGKWARKIRLQMDQAGGHGGGRATTRDDKGMNRTTNALKKWAQSSKGRAMMHKHGFVGELEFEAQPSKSPDFTVLDLGLWRSLEAVAARIQRNYLFMELAANDSAVANADNNAVAQVQSIVRTSVGDRALENAAKIASRWRESAASRMSEAQKQSQRRRSGESSNDVQVSDEAQSRRDSAFVSIIKNVAVAFEMLNPSTIESLCQVLNVVLESCVKSGGDNSATSFHGGVKREEARMAAVRAMWPDQTVPPPPLAPDAQRLVDQHVKDLEKSHPQRIKQWVASLDQYDGEGNELSNGDDSISPDRRNFFSDLFAFFQV